MRVLHFILVVSTLIKTSYCLNDCDVSEEINYDPNENVDVNVGKQEGLSPSSGGLWPKNLTVERTSSTSVKITWNVKSDEGLKWQMEYNPIPAKYRVISDVPTRDGCMVLERLLPKTKYQVRLVGLVNRTIAWSSPTITFTTDKVVATKERSSVRAEEIGIVLLVLAFWMFAIVLFFNRWGKIRMLEPYHEPFKEPPIHSHRVSCPGLVEPCILSKLRMLDYPAPTRPRLGSLAVVGRSYSISSEIPPRRVRSAVNLTSLVLHECDEELGFTATSTSSMTTAV